MAMATGMVMETVIVLEMMMFIERGDQYEDADGDNCENLERFLDALYLI